MLIARNEYLQDLLCMKDKNVIKVVTGIRRCGKSTLFLLYQKELLARGIAPEQIINVNLEDGDLRALDTAEALYRYVQERLLSQRQNYVFLDEVQRVADWQRAVDWLYTKINVDVYLTGSNAFLLSGELATLLSGRYVEVKMMPLSFAEYASAFPEQSNPAQLYQNYLTNSSFPGTLEFTRAKDIHSYLEGIYNTILMKDIITRKNIANPAMLESVVEFMFDSIGSLCSPSSIANTMTSKGRKISVQTVESYLEALRDSFILYRANRYDIKGKARLERNVKYYVADIGLRYFLLGSQQNDHGHILENVVFLELLRRGYEVYVGKVGEVEVDFIAVKGGFVEYYQVALTVLDETTLARELAPLKAIRDHNTKFLLTMDYTPAVSHNGIRQLNVLDWLLKQTQ